MMKFRNAFAFAASSAMAVICCQSIAAAEPLELSKAVRVALERSPEKGQAEARTLQAEAAKDAASRTWLPKVTVEGVAGYRRIDNATRINLGLSSLNEKPLYGTLSVDQPLFDMGRRMNELRTQRALLSAAKESQNLTTQVMAYTAARAYLQLLLQQRIGKDAIENLAFHEGIAADMREGVTKGAMSISERQQADERLLAARARKAQSDKDLEAARNDFAAVIGLPPEGLEFPATAVPLLPATLDDAVAGAAANDPRIKAAGFNLAAAEAGYRRARAESGPTLDLGGSASAGRDFDGYSGETKDYRATVSLRWRLFDGGVIAARAREAFFKVQESQFALTQTQRDSERDIRNAWAQLGSLRTQQSEQEARAAVAAEVLSTYRAQFSIGRRSLLDVLDAQNARFSAQVEADSARVGALLAEYAILVQMTRLTDLFGYSEKPVSGKMGP